MKGYHHRKKLINADDIIKKRIERLLKENRMAYISQKAEIRRE
jgi:hypothetical protein